MIWLFVILVAIASAVLAFFVLVQNPKGGGLAGNVGGLSNQLMGVKQTTDVLERGTWIFAGIIAVLSILSTLMLNNKATVTEEAGKAIKGVNTTTAPQQQTPANTVPATQQTAPAPAPAPKK